jgi:Ca2+-binding EF-hand superfamily protein
MHSRQVITLGILVLFLVPLLALGQFPQGGGKGGKGGKGGFGGKKMFGDPGQMFDMIAQGKPSISRDDVQNPFFQGMFDNAVRASGSTDGRLTRDQFITAMSGMQAQFGGKGGKGGKGMKGGWGMPSMPSPDQTLQWDKEAEVEFRQADANGDGKLNEDEMPPQLHRQLDRYDLNKDGQIDLIEYKSYYRDRVMQMSGQGRDNLTITTGNIDDDAPFKRPDVFRVGNLPKVLPAWFLEYDTDQDGQVGLYEWRKFGKSLKEFQEYDQNEDGFITPSEVIRWMAKNGELDQSPGTMLAQNNQNSPGQSPTVYAPNGNGGNRFGPGNFPGKGKKGGKGNKGSKRGMGGEE